jgi:hypothetical protein
MRTLAEIEKRLELYDFVELIYDEGTGYIAWHYSTGDNIEMLFIEAPGHGTEMYAQFVKLLQSSEEKPYHSVFAYRLGSNTRAAKFYDKLGWKQVNLGPSIYKGDDTVFMWITWDDLVTNLQRFKLL